jgi:glycosyltransferase involved in cell wall biosynthesis
VLPAADVAGCLAASDLYLSPFVDGVSTRRTTLMAALQHRLAVVGTRGHFTDRILDGDETGLVLVDVAAGAGQFAEAVAGLAGDRRELARRAALARRTFDGHFSWPVLAERFMSAVEEAAG